MWKELIFCLIVTAIFVLVLLILYIDYMQGDKVTKSRWSRLQKLWDEGAFKNEPLKVSKDVIYAMIQRGIYSLNSNVESEENFGEVLLWTREMLEKSSSKLEQNHENVGKFKKMVNDFVEKVEKSIEEYEDNLCKLNNELELITETHQFIKKEIQKQLCQAKQQIATAASDNCNRSWVPPVPSIRCPIIADAQAEDDFLTILDQFEEARGIP
ncbi:uncharacterized protein LOC100575174 [Acyrthosiphon pisum]|uniref:Uncharacterized protein n=1 Tax=Acyrthosiphon pisum TaxID=7029 RepID=A0A8R1W6A5_ACYPI|nr:uncharacterized protein LOC100575174 [Acyrthosiphon pisum]|eukprot:XP_003245750.1 PREDICTED: uncharacterized protein LOC100575174 [Acyrthosiphon pisum]